MRKRDVEKQRNRETEKQRNRETEKLRDRETNDTQDTHDILPLAVSVKTLQEAVQISLKDGYTKNCLFALARAIKAFEITHDRSLPPTERRNAFALWWNTAQALLPPDADYDEFLFVFEDTYKKTRSALGSNSLEEAIRRVNSNPLPPECDRYSSPKIKRLVAVCFHLQVLQGNSPFFISTRDAADVSGASSPGQASAWLAGLVGDEIFDEVEKGTRARATRFWFNRLKPKSANAGKPGKPPQ